MNGFGHNFLAVNSTTPQRPLATVMSYPPFAVADRTTTLAAGDRERLRRVYGGQAVLPAAPSAADYCSTFAAIVPERDGDGYYRTLARCDVFTVGPPAGWYLRLARQGRAGVFTEFPDLSHLSEDMRQAYRRAASSRRLPPFNLLTRLGYVLADSSSSNDAGRREITAYLCSLAQGRPRVAKQLLTYHRVTLDCAAR